MLFDASALLNIVRALGAGSLEYLRGGYALTLTPYEIGNALWKEATLLGRISEEEAVSTLETVLYLFGVLKVTSPKDARLVLKLARKLGVTYYDSSYLVASWELGTVLVTDDEKLRRRVEEGGSALESVLGGGVKTISTKELIREFQKAR
jgi:predicted nucleic acid-binding protein